MAIKSIAQKLLRTFVQHFSPSSSSSASSRKTNVHSTNSKLWHEDEGESLHLHNYQAKTVVVDVEACLLKSSSTFPYFMATALEAGGGGLLRGLLLLLSYPFVCLLPYDMGIRLMVLLTFCGLRRESLARVGKAILPKHFLGDVTLQGFEMLKKIMGHCHGHGRVICMSRMPRVMVEAFLKEYLEVEYVLGRELRLSGGFYTGFMQGEGEELLQLKEPFKGGSHQMTAATEFVIFSSSTFVNSQLLSLSPYCKERLLVGKEQKIRWQVMPKEQYPKPLIFHDGRLAFRPTPLNTFSMFLWLPFGFILALLRLAISLSFPYNLSTPILTMTNMKWRLLHQTNSNESGENPTSRTDYTHHHPNTTHKRGQLFVCNHRTLIDPIYISAAINRPVHAVCYSLSRVSEILSPISTVRLTRNRKEDAKIMGKLLDRGESVVVCPEGTTCREPYLLRFSPLFTELSDDVVPVAVNVRTNMFYATTAGGWKCFDPLYYLMNPSMCYEIQFLEKIDTSNVTEKQYGNTDMANHVQREIGKALGFQCTMLTRKDKYMILAGNDGIVGKS